MLCAPSGRLEIGVGRDVDGNIAVEHGPLVLAGHIAGRVTASTANVVLGPTARIDGDLLVVGGDVEGRNNALIGGAVRIYRDSLIYSEESDRITASGDGTRFNRRERRVADSFEPSPRRRLDRGTACRAGRSVQPR